MNGINSCLRGALVVVTSIGAVPAAYGTSLAVLLSDAQYALNRYQELDSGFCDTLPKDSQRGCEKTQRGINGNVESIKPVLLRASKARNPSATDLLDIYAELEEISARLWLMGSEADTLIPNHPVRQDIADAIDKTEDLGVNFYLELRKRVNALEKGCAR
jgi:hypothetical protein